MTAAAKGIITAISLPYSSADKASHTNDTIVSWFAVAAKIEAPRALHGPDAHDMAVRAPMACSKKDNTHPCAHARWCNCRARAHTWRCKRTAGATAARPAATPTNPRQPGNMRERHAQHACKPQAQMAHHLGTSWE
eukprot:CAMPEP_0202868838 /NCGR_PEP_ID=MMETSP1391-20130828/11197_1 /ASSEMBLY_ACC=CAM_ASM_000867 /TAXON_ID=1034604 /ORGANISM="Chlamydomonas leiostraca, Strain SAG 11-49" /LENGTH=135 /DNA_ID=CAMNT_0049549051 /DNA_START=510 /DNA_END=917 /DNA_ORIENTATION=+